MARNGVRYEDVRQAIDLLLQRRETPSVQKIREVLGTGSFTTISDHFRQWRLEHQQQREISPSLLAPEPLQALMRELWRQAQEMASEGLSDYRTAADQQVDEAKQEASAAARRAEDAAQREAAVAEHLAQVQARMEEKASQLAKAEAERDAVLRRESRARDQIAHLEAQLAHLQQHGEQQAQEHQQALAKLAEHHQEQLAQEEQRHEAAEARLMKLLDDARQERQAADKQHIERQAQLEKRLIELDRQIHEQRSAFSEEERLRREANWELRQHQDRHKEMAFKQEQLEAQVQEKNLALEQLQKKLTDAEAHLARAPLPPFVY